MAAAAGLAKTRRGQLLRGLEVHALEVDPQRAVGRFREQVERGRAEEHAVADDGHAAHGGEGAQQQLELLGPGGDVEGEAREVAVRPRLVGHEARLDGIGQRDEEDRDRLRLVAQGEHHLGAGSHHERGPQGHDGARARAHVDGGEHVHLAHRDRGAGLAGDAARQGVRIHRPARARAHDHHALGRRRGRRPLAAPAGQRRHREEQCRGERLHHSDPLAALRRGPGPKFVMARGAAHPPFLPRRVGRRPALDYAAVVDTHVFTARLLARASALRQRPEVAGYAMRRVSSCTDWAAVRALRRAALASHGDIASPAAEPRDDGYDTAPASQTFLLVRDGRPLGSTRATLSRGGAPARLPAMDAFARDVRSAAGAEAVVEASLVVIDPGAADPAGALLRLFKAPLLACATGRAAWLLVAVRESQMGFYRRAFGMEILGGAECLAGLAVPRVLMGLRYREQASQLFRRFPVLAPTIRDEGRFAARGEVGFPDGRDPLPCE